MFFNYILLLSMFLAKVKQFEVFTLMILDFLLWLLFFLLKLSDR